MYTMLRRVVLHQIMSNVLWSKLKIFRKLIFREGIIIFYYPICFHVQCFLCSLRLSSFDGFSAFVLLLNDMSVYKLMYVLLFLQESILSSSKKRIIKLTMYVFLKFLLGFCFLHCQYE